MDAGVLIISGLILVFILLVILARKGTEKPTNQIKPAPGLLIRTYLLLIKILPEIVLFVGCILIVLRLLFPPKYIYFQGTKIIHRDGFSSNFYLEPDINSALLQSLAIAILTGLLYLLIRKINLNKIEKPMTNRNPLS
jgi:hypothetical protein